MSARVLGILVFVLAAAAAVVYGLLPRDGDHSFAELIFGSRPEQVQAMGFVGGEKRNFLADQRVEEVLLERYGIVLDARRAGSLAMVTDRVLIDQAPSFYWPSSQVARELARVNGIEPLQTEIIFNSPIVLFSWSPVAEALRSLGLAQAQPGSAAAFTVDTAGLLRLVLDEVTWQEIGIRELYGGVMVFSTDPTRSNSGNQFAVLSATVLAGGETDGPAFDDAVGRIADLYRRMGYTEGSSSTLFEQYLRQGMGAFPIIAGYENQLIEFAAANRSHWDALEDRSIRPVILYPEPTVYSSHVFMAMDDVGRNVVEALADPELQDLAWRAHGFRSGFAAANDPTSLPVSGVPESLGMIVPMPPFDAVERILQAVNTGRP